MLLDNAEFIPGGFRERAAAAVLRVVGRLLLRPALSPHVAITRRRRWLKLVMRAIRANYPVHVEAGTVGGVGGEWTRPAAGTSTKATILYLHGGAYSVGSAKTHRSIAALLAQATGLAVFAADYRLAPEAPFPAAVEDAFAAYRELTALGAVAIAGDSAGGGLTMATALAARERHVTPPQALILFAPWVDLTAEGLPAQAPAGDVILDIEWINRYARDYLAGADAKTPLASPVFADLARLPPTLIQTGTDDILHGQALRLHAALLAAGNAVDCEIIRDRWHAFQMLAGWLPSADAAIARAGQFIRRNIAP